jgi:hypothetical protein
MPLQATSGAASYDAFGGGVAAGPANYIEDVFSTWLYTGTGSTQTITNGIDLAGKGGLVWEKFRSGPSGTGSHVLTDTVRGAGKYIMTNSTAAQATSTTFGAQAFYTNGFLSSAYPSSDLAASWTFREQAKFFDVVTYTGNGTAGRTVAHNLGSVPGCIIVKRTDATRNWVCYHRSLGNGSMIILNSTAAVDNASALWNNTTPTATNFTVNNDADVNANGATYVAYLFAHDAGGFGLTGTDNVISCGSFTGTGGISDINLGYEPQWLLFKNASSGSSSWIIVDNMRGLGVSSNTTQFLYPNLSSAESTGDYPKPTATGFQHSITNGQTGIYIAIRRGPMKVPTTGTSVYTAATRAGTGAATNITGLSFPPDSYLTKTYDNAIGTQWLDRLRGPFRLQTASTAAEDTSAPQIKWDINNGVALLTGDGVTNFSGFNYVYYAMRRAPSFFDEVCYTGTGSLPGVTHNLGVTPELKIIKRRNFATDWVVGGSIIGEDGYVFLNTTAAFTSSSNYWDGGNDSATVFSVRNTNSMSDASGGTYVAYLFATCPGVSKVGSFTGTGATQVINCGFTGGARFVLIKATSTTGSWYVWDSARGIVAGNDPYLLLNSTAAEVTTTNWVDTAATGFELSNAGGNLVNSSGVSYIFLAIA